MGQSKATARNTREHSEAHRDCAGVTKAHLSALLPIMAGIMLSRTGTVVGAYGSYASTDAGIYTDGASAISLAPLIIAMVALGVTEKIISKSVIYHITRACFVIEAAALATAAYFEAQAVDFTQAHLAATVAITLSSWLSVFYWLRRCRGTSCIVAVVTVMGALVASETILYLMSPIPHSAQCAVAAIAMLGQFPAAAIARKRTLPAQMQLASESRGYFHFAQKNADSVRFLAILAIGMFLLSIAIGLLKGFPDGKPITFTPITRFLYMALIDAVLIGLIVGTVTGRNAMTVGVWVAMQALGTIALILFALFPYNLDIGAVFGNAMNVAMTGFMFYLVIAFSSHGHLDTYYYAIAGWSVFILPRSIARFTNIALYEYFPSAALPVALCGGLLLISAQFIFLQFLTLEHSETAETKAAAINVQKLLGIKEKAAPGTEMRRAIIEESARAMQQQFLLSDRETEVLALYATGLTQAKIAEKLCIAQGTAHTHIKRIYSKTDLHSRQALIDYIEQYAD